MAIKHVIINHTSLAFPSTRVGESATLSVTFTNSSSGPPDSVDITIEPGSPPFSIAVADESFTLLTNGDSKTVDFTFTPTSAGDYTGYGQNITASNGFTFDPAATEITTTGHAWSNTVDLIDTVVPAGTLSVQLTYDISVGELYSTGFKSSLTPTQNLLAGIDEHVEKVDVKLGTYEYDALTVKLIEDYSKYPEGLWYRIFRTAPLVPLSALGVSGPVLKMAITMTEGGTKRFVMYGRVDPQSVKGAEFALTSAKNVRGFEMQVVSGLDLLKMVTSQALCIECASHIVSVNVKDIYHLTNYNTAVIKFVDVLASAVSLAFGQTFASTDIQIRRASGISDEDIQIGIEASGGNWDREMFTFDNLYMLGGGADDGVDPFYYPKIGDTLTGTISSSGTTLTGVGTLFTTELAPVGGVNATIIDALGQVCTIDTISSDTSATVTAAPGIAFSGSKYQRFHNGKYWGQRYSNAFDIAQAICFPFGLVPRYYFGQDDGTYVGDGSDRHHIELLSRGRALDYVNPIGVVNDSMNEPTSPRNVQSVRCSFPDSIGTDNWYVNNGASQGGAPPPSLSFDIDINTEFTAASTVLLVPVDSAIFVHPSGSASYGIANMTQYWNYKTKAIVGPTLSLLALALHYATDVFTQYVAEYFYYKFHGQSGYEREYGDIRATDTVSGTTTQWNLRPLRRHQITDEIGTRNYYAIEVRKDYFKNRAKVVWFEE